MDGAEWDRELRELQQALAAQGYTFVAAAVDTWADRCASAWLCVAMIERSVFGRADDETRRELELIRGRAVSLCDIAAHLARDPSR